MSEIIGAFDSAGFGDGPGVGSEDERQEPLLLFWQVDASHHAAGLQETLVSHGASLDASIPPGTVVLLWAGSIAASIAADVPALSIDSTRYVLAMAPGHTVIFAIPQDQWVAAYTAEDLIQWVYAHSRGWRRGQPRITRHDPLVILHWASAPFAGQQLGTNLQPLLPYPDPTVSPVWNAMLYGPGVAQNRVIVPRRVQADYTAAATWVWVLTATGALYSVNVDGSNPVLATFPRLLTNTAAVGAVLTTLVHSVANEAGDTGYIEQYETVAGVVQCWGEFKVQYDAGAWRKWGLISGGVFFGGTDYIIAQWPNTTGVAASHFTRCRSLARTAQGVVWAGGPVGTLADPDQSTPTTPDYYWSSYPTAQGGIFFSATLDLRTRQNTAMSTTGGARETTLDVHGAPSAVSSGAANGILPLRIGGGGFYSDGFTVIEPLIFGTTGLLQTESFGQPDGQLGIDTASDLSVSAIAAATLIGKDANVWIGDSALYYAASADRSTSTLLLNTVIAAGDVVPLLTRIGGADRRVYDNPTITLVCVHGQGGMVAADTITIPFLGGVPQTTTIVRGSSFPFPTDVHWTAGADGTGATSSAGLSGAYIGPILPDIDYAMLVKLDGASSYFPLTESGVTVTDLIHGDTLAITGSGTAPTPAALAGIPGVPGTTAWTFHAGQYLQGTVASVPSGTGQAFTLEAWVHPPVASTNSGVFGWGDGTASGSTGMLIDSLKRPGMSGTSTDEIDFIALPSSGWHHVVATRSAGNVLNAYLDGAIDPTGETDDTAQALIATAFQIGHSPREGDPFTGSLAHIAVYPLLLTATQISAHYRAGTG